MCSISTFHVKPIFQHVLWLEYMYERAASSRWNLNLQDPTCPLDWCSNRLSYRDSSAGCSLVPRLLQGGSCVIGLGTVLSWLGRITHAYYQDKAKHLNRRHIIQTMYMYVRSLRPVSYHRDYETEARELRQQKTELELQLPSLCIPDPDISGELSSPYSRLLCTLSHVRGNTCA